ncbi:MAG: hypothetical protein AAF483_25285 [Planctomycetota bacterium]
MERLLDFENAKSVPTLRRLHVQVSAFTGSELRQLAEVTRVEQLSLGSLQLTDEHIGTLKNFDPQRTATRRAPEETPLFGHHKGKGQSCTTRHCREVRSLMFHPCPSPRYKFLSRASAANFPKYIDRYCIEISTTNGKRPSQWLSPI